MASKVVQLSVHKNTKARRERRELRADMVRAASAMGSLENLAGYVLIGIGRNGAAYAAWDTGRAIPVWSVPSLVAEAIRTDINDYMAEHEGKDDFDPKNAS